MAGLLPNCTPVPDYGIDHGTWCPLRFFYPKADIPTIQLSVNAKLFFEAQIMLGEQLRILREEGFLIFASGNIVHNLRLVDFQQKNGFV